MATSASTPRAGSTCSVEIRVNGVPAPTLYQVADHPRHSRRTSFTSPTARPTAGATVSAWDRSRSRSELGRQGKDQQQEWSARQRIALIPAPEPCPPPTPTAKVREVPAGMQVYVYADGWSATMVTTPDNATCGDGNAAQTELNIPLAAADDSVGRHASKLVSATRPRVRCSRCRSSASAAPSRSATATRVRASRFRDTRHSGTGRPALGHGVLHTLHLPGGGESRPADARRPCP